MTWPDTVNVFSLKAAQRMLKMLCKVSDRYSKRSSIYPKNKQKRFFCKFSIFQVWFCKGEYQYFPNRISSLFHTYKRHKTRLGRFCKNDFCYLRLTDDTPYNLQRRSAQLCWQVRLMHCEYVRNETLNDIWCDILFDRSGPAAPIPELGRPGSEGGDAGYGAVTAPNRQARMTGSDSCTQNCERFRNKIVEELRGKAQPVVCLA